MSDFRSVIIGCGSYLPEKILTNSDLEQLVDTSDKWIVQRTGIQQRHIAADDEVTSDLGFKAATKALESAKIDPQDIDQIILATTTPDQTFPASAVTIQDRLGIRHGSAFDIQATCSGFLFALTTADVYIRTGISKRILVIAADTITRLVDWDDRTTCVLFGEGSGAVVLERQANSGTVNNSGILTCQLRTDGSHRDKVFASGGPSSTQTTGHLRMKGIEVFKHAVGFVSDVIENVIAETNISVEELDWFIPHQANRRIIDATVKKLKIAPEKVIVTVDQHGNTSAASIPLALDVAVKDGRVKKGDLVMFGALGGGFTWGAVLIRL